MKRRFAPKLLSAIVTLWLLVTVITTAWGFVTSNILQLGDLPAYLFGMRWYWYFVAAISLAFLLAVVILFADIAMQDSPFKRRRTAILAGDKERIRVKILECDVLIRQGTASNFRSAVVTLDSLLDYILTLHGYTGTLGEKLKAADKRFRNPNHVWHAHKHRNQLVHQIDYEPLPLETKESYNYFLEAFEDLGAL